MSYYPTTYGNLTVTTNPWQNLSSASGQYVVNTSIDSAWTSSTVIRGKTLQMDEDADIKFGEASLMETLREIQSQLGMLTPDPKLEEEFEELRACAQEYERLRAKFLEQKRMWEILKQEMIDQ
jgi:hypothetical protein